jgi:hypothetical protein
MRAWAGSFFLIALPAALGLSAPAEQVDGDQRMGRWENVTPGSGNLPDGRTIVFDPRRQRIVMVTSSSIWEWDGLQWTHLAAPAVAPPSIDVAVYHPPRGTIVTYGGIAPGGVVDQTWEWNGVAWSNRTVAGARPPPLWGTAMAWDARRQRMVMFGGFETVDFVYTRAVTWEWDGVTGLWAAVPPADPAAPQPGQRGAHSLVWDESGDGGGRMVLFGSAPVDIWEWDGAARTWTERTSPPLPERFQRFGHRAAYDPVRQVTLLVGGDAASGTVSALEWDGVTGRLSRLLSATGPGARCFPAAAYDRARGRLVVHGGIHCDFSSPIFDTWELPSDTVGAVDGGAPPDASDTLPAPTDADVSPGPMIDAAADVAETEATPTDTADGPAPPALPTRARKGAYEGCACQTGGPSVPAPAAGVLALAVVLWRQARRPR